MTKKTRPHPKRNPGNTTKTKKRTVPRTQAKTDELKEKPDLEIALQESASENPPEETGPGTIQVDPPSPLPVSSASPSVQGESGKAADLPEVEAVLEMLAFRLADEEYAVDILMIREIIRPMEITRVPRSPFFIKGIISLRGMIIPVFDLRTRLGLAESPPDRNTRILVVGLEKGLIGVIADCVTEVVKVKSHHVEPPPAVGGGSSSGYLKGVTRVIGRLLILLDLEKVIALESGD